SMACDQGLVTWPREPHSALQVRDRIARKIARQRGHSPSHCNLVLVLIHSATTPLRSRSIDRRNCTAKILIDQKSTRDIYVNVNVFPVQWNGHAVPALRTKTDRKV